MESGQRLTIRGYKGNFWMMQMFYILAVVVNIQVWTFVKTHRTSNFK